MLQKNTASTMPLLSSPENTKHQAVFNHRRLIVEPPCLFLLHLLQEIELGQL